MYYSSDKDTPNVHIYDANSPESTPLHTLTIHHSPVKIIKYNEPYDVVVTADSEGVLEYWNGSDYKFPEDVQFRYKMDTDLYEFAKVINEYIYR